MILALVPDPWKDELTLPDNLAAIEAKREEERIADEIRERAFALMFNAGVMTFADAMEMVKGGGI